ncbi:uncharacterized protein LOC130015687 [Mercurialis annua]|uniref:uncharacterized protein LOC130015687 n=1 Tax=Mercurialis annua TaxID=3986 RepID=UPI0024AE2835|nr:uncharacterized protein LOC130015687 [Mercurialis annua]
MNSDRSWMYIGRLVRGLLTEGYISNVREFLNFALQHPECMSGAQIKCPCPKPKCRNTAFRTVDEVEFHLYTDGFVSNYHVWAHHGEENRRVEVPINVLQADNMWEHRNEDEGCSSFQRMVTDAGGPEVWTEEPPNAEAEKFYDMMRAAEEPIWPVNDKHSALSAAVNFLEFKCRFQASDGLMNEMSEFVHQLLPKDNKLAKNSYNIKKLVGGLGLPVEVIDCCKNMCMIYWGGDAGLTVCKVCGHDMWKPATAGSSKGRKTNRLYASRATAKHMRWHAEHEIENGVMNHSSDSPAWKHFSELHQDFAAEIRNIRLGLCTDEFQPFGAFGQQYSSWPVIVTPYNLPPGMAMKDEFMFLTVLELNHLWKFGTRTYDIHRRQNFQLKAALMWTINDFPAYSMLSGWSTSGKRACPHYMEETDAITLPKSGKQSWFDFHRKFLPPEHSYRNNTTDFKKGYKERKSFRGYRTGEEIEQDIDSLGFKNAYEFGARDTNAQKFNNHGWHKKSIFWDLSYWKTNMILLNVLGKTKDHAKSREELNDIFNRTDLAFNPSTGQYPKAIYALDKNAKQALLEWVKELKFPRTWRLLPIAFREFLHPSVWEPITELSIFFKDLTCTTLKEDNLIKMEKDIAKILCKLERIFPPSFFDSMEHLPIHLPNEAKLAGPVQYRWMYPFERYLRKLKRKVTNKAKVEGSISIGYLYEEIAKFASFYFNDGDPTLPDRLQRNETRDDVVDDDVDRPSIFKSNGRPIGASKKRSLEEDEYTAAHSYILLNCPEIEHYKDLYVYELYEIIPGITQVQVEVNLETEFASWFERYAYGENQLTMNSGVCVKGSLYAPTESDFYGILTDVLELEYSSLPIKRIVLFKFNWFDPTDRVVLLLICAILYNLKFVGFPLKMGDERFEQEMLAATQTAEGSTTSTPVDPDEVYLAVEGVRKRRIYGLGSVGFEYVASHRGTSSRRAGSSSQTVSLAADARFLTDLIVQFADTIRDQRAPGDVLPTPPPPPPPPPPATDDVVPDDDVTDLYIQDQNIFILGNFTCFSLILAFLCFCLGVAHTSVSEGFVPSKETLKKVRRRCVREMDYDSNDRVESLAKKFEIRMGA